MTKEDVWDWVNKLYAFFLNLELSQTLICRGGDDNKLTITLSLDMQGTVLIQCELQEKAASKNSSISRFHTVIEPCQVHRMTNFFEVVLFIDQPQKIKIPETGKHFSFSM